MNTGFTVIGHFISWYSVMGFAGLVAGCVLCWLRYKKYSVPGDDILNLAGYGVIGALAGGKLLALLCMIPQFIQYWDDINWSMNVIYILISHGFVFYGGLFGMIIAFYIYCKQYGVCFSDVMELVTPSIPLFHSIGRIGCYIAGCCYGVLYFPLQLIASGFNILLVIILLLMQRLGVRKTIFWYFIMYGIGRFIIEFYRGDMERGFIGILSVSQWISLVAVTVSLYILIQAKLKKSNRQKEDKVIS